MFVRGRFVKNCTAYGLLKTCFCIEKANYGHSHIIVKVSTITGVYVKHLSQSYLTNDYEVHG